MLLLEGTVPRLIDEWQMAPVLWDAVRFAVDRRGATGQFILTGSAVPNDGVTQHTGTGRISRMWLRPMSLFESGESNGTVSLRDLFEGSDDVSCLSSLSVEALAFALALAAAHLLALRDRVDTGRLQSPSFLMVLTATDVGYTRPDGVVVVPIGCLRP